MQATKGGSDVLIVVRRLCRQMDLTLPTHPYIQTKEALIDLRIHINVMHHNLDRHLYILPSCDGCMRRMRRGVPCGSVKTGTGFRGFLLAAESQRQLSLVEQELQKLRKEMTHSQLFTVRN